jgi:hypothetical protein
MSTLSVTEQAIRDRLLDVLKTMALLMPSLSVTIEVWRPKVVSVSEFADEGKEVWIRLAENVPAFYLEDMNRWFDKEIGIVLQNDHKLLIPDGCDVRPDDHVIVNGEAWMVVGSVEQAGISQLKIDKAKSRFRVLARELPIYRELGIKVRIA